MRRPLIVNGFMATGKSTIGGLVAQAAGRPFIDLDRAIESEGRETIDSLFATRGEAAFRALERACLTRILAEAESASEPPVIAVGGGALGLSRSRDFEQAARAQSIAMRVVMCGR